jgi:prepilin-type N-terminal cleavage/methylation domain-containing protein
MKKGFTLIEVMVSVTIFSIVMVIALGSLLAISSSDRKAETLKTVMNNLSFALDSMSRSIRTGVNYDCNPSLPISSGSLPSPTDCTSGAPVMAYHSADGATGAGDSPIVNANVVFCRGSGSSCSADGTSILRSTDGGDTFFPITAPEVVISDLTFYVKGAPLGDGIQPKVTLTLSGFVRVSGNASSQSECNTTSGQCSVFNMQTSITQRLYDQ